MSLKDFLFGKKASTKKLPAISPGQQNFLSSLLQQLQSQGGSSDISQNPLFQSAQGNLLDLLSNDSSAYEDFAEPYMRQYNQDILPAIAEKFAGMGAGSSSALNQTLARSAENFGGSLASLRAGLQQGALGPAFSFSQAPSQNYQGLGSLALGVSPFAYANRGGSGGLLQGIGGGFGNAFGSGLGLKPFLG